MGFLKLIHRFKASKAIVYITEIFLEVKNFNDPDLVTKSSERGKKKHLKNMSDGCPAQQTKSETLNRVIGQIPAPRSQYPPKLQNTLYERSIFQPHTTNTQTGNEPWHTYQAVMINISQKEIFNTSKT
ncbi:hypothetical protein M9H77_08887 [Catharanthus roseus]|uniref:Uncharacterized protein n=1 Tax=Catharanthus roseus TaxID=4058 RepID=A0ACC0BZB9_CATRO|nr:hypothetical protein M9H77_08887 [Catharanthus roseus]